MKVIYEYHLWEFEGRFQFLYMEGSRQMWVIQGSCICTCMSGAHLMEVHLPES